MGFHGLRSLALLLGGVPGRLPMTRTLRPIHLLNLCTHRSPGQPLAHYSGTQAMHRAQGPRHRHADCIALQHWTLRIILKTFPTFVLSLTAQATDVPAARITSDPAPSLTISPTSTSSEANYTLCAKSISFSVFVSF